jgi:hypothetical protein
MAPYTVACRTGGSSVIPQPKLGVTPALFVFTRTAWAEFGWGWETACTDPRPLRTRVRMDLRAYL